MPNLSAPAPGRTPLLPQLRSLVKVIDEQAQIRRFELGKSKAERLLRFPIAQDGHAVVHRGIQIVDPQALFVRKRNHSLRIDPKRQVP
jgi:hypothetical protein